MDAKADIDPNNKLKLWSQTKKKQTSLKLKNQAKKVYDNISKSCFNLNYRKPELELCNSNIHGSLRENEQIKIIEIGKTISSKAIRVDWINDNKQKPHQQLSNHEILITLNESATIIQSWKTLQDLKQKIY